MNDVEARFIVQTLRQLCADDRYRNKTFGVISLLGDGQAPHIQALLVEALGEREMERRRVRCGSAYHFQGDERDVVFLSMVVSPGEGRVGAFTKPADQQRINVAASRARDQLWLVRSIQADQLHPEDLRGRLIRHCQSPADNSGVFVDLAERCESDFEREVLRHLLTRGYSIWPQFPVGKMRIDFVVRGERERLAVECDGDAWHGPDQWDEDRRRQEILERLGWKFYRVRGGAFYRDPERALAALWGRLTSLGITPGTWWQPNGGSSGKVASRGGRVEQEGDGTRVGLSPPGDEATNSEPPASTRDVGPPVAEEETEDTAEADDSTVDPVEVTGPDEQGDLPYVGGGLPPELRLSPAEVGLSEYRAWVARRLKPVEEATPEEVTAGLEEIIRAEGPMVASRAYQLYVTASGGKRVGKAIRRTLNRVTAHAVRSGRFSQIRDDELGQVTKTMFIPGTDAVVPRKRGPRDLEEVPATEIADVMRRVQRLRAAAAPVDLKRIILHLYERARMTTMTEKFLDKVLRARYR